MDENDNENFQAPERTKEEIAEDARLLNKYIKERSDQEDDGPMTALAAKRETQRKETWIKNIIKIQKFTQEQAEALWDKINGRSK